MGVDDLCMNVGYIEVPMKGQETQTQFSGGIDENLLSALL